MELEPMLYSLSNNFIEKEDSHDEAVSHNVVEPSIDTLLGTDLEDHEQGYCYKACWLPC